MKISKEQLLDTIVKSSMENENKTFIVAIDGRCASGKSTVATFLKENIDCNVISMDDFFLRSEQRTKERLEQAGGNVDYERFLTSVMMPLVEGRNFSYRPFDCHTQELMEEIPVTQKKVTIIEGSYSCHPKLWQYYNLRIFLNVDSEEQIRRIKIRNTPESVEMFKNKWIPMEEKYFDAFNIQSRCHYEFTIE